jgi:lysophospholipase L1-like esterase
VRRLLRIVLGCVFFVAFTGVLLEGLLALWLACPALPATPLASRLYAADTLYPQFDPDCARADPELFYVLKPGRCRFDTREFRTELHMNSGGWRDDEASLLAPPVIAAGDSTTMGWGVAAEEAWPQRLEALLGVRVLDMGVPSYGTRREIAALDRVDTSALSTLIVQFATNDHSENKFFLTAGTLRASGERYARQTAEAVARAPWWPGKYVWTALTLLGEKRDSPLSPRKADKEVQAFLHALRHASSLDLSQVHVIVFVMEPFGGRYGPAFLAALDAARAADPDPGWLGRLTGVDVSADIQPEFRYRLDGHITAEGHRRVAERLAAAIRAAGGP